MTDLTNGTGHGATGPPAGRAVANPPPRGGDPYRHPAPVSLTLF
jgi:hypothetical protein